MAYVDFWLLLCEEPHILDYIEQLKEVDCYLSELVFPERITEYMLEAGIVCINTCGGLYPSNKFNDFASYVEMFHG